MPTDFGSLKKLDGLPALRRAQPGNARRRLLVLIKIQKGFTLPDYVERRSEPAPGFFSAVIPDDQLPRLEADPAIASISVSRSLPPMD